jgi:hypothetical protein
LKVLDQVREQGYGEDNEEQEEGLRCIAVPVFDRRCSSSFTVRTGNGYNPSARKSYAPQRATSPHIRD